MEKLYTDMTLLIHELLDKLCTNLCFVIVGFDIDTPDDFGRTCLHAAAAGGYVSVTCLHV